MEERKEKEIAHYNRKGKELHKDEIKGDFEDFNPFLVKSYNFLRYSIEDKYRGKKILDYGCGNGIHSMWLSDLADELIGIDLSENLLSIAENKIKGVKFIKMDCEILDFEDNSFDVVFDGGTFSSLDVSKAFSEIKRVLRKEGKLIGIETLGHNPILNLKRKINKIRGIRTEWAASHIFKMKDIEKAKEHFGEIETYFFHLTSWIAFPFIGFKGGRFMLRLFERIDGFLILLMPFLKRYSFKIVFIFSKPKK